MIPVRMVAKVMFKLIWKNVKKEHLHKWKAKLSFLSTFKLLHLHAPSFLENLTLRHHHTVASAHCLSYTVMSRNYAQW